MQANVENQTTWRRTGEIQNAVGVGALDSPLYINVFSGRRRRRPLPRYRETAHFFSAEGWCEQHHGASRTSPPTKCYQNIVGAPLVARYQTNGTNKRFGGAPHIVSHRRGGVSPPVFYKRILYPNGGRIISSPTKFAFFDLCEAEY